MSPKFMQRKDALAALCHRYSVRRLELFGSAAMNTSWRPESDLDFLVEFGEVPSGQYADTYFGLLDSLQHLFGRPVDLVVARAIKNPYFRQLVEQTKTLVYAA